METDQVLVARSAAGDETAFAHLVERHYASCWRFARRMLGDDADAEDALHDSLIRMRSALPRYREQDSFRGWLFSILANRCRSHASARRRRESRFVASDRLDLIADDTASGGFVDERLTRAIATLSAEAREILLLKHGEGFEYKEIGKMLGISESAAKMRVSRACQAVRDQMEVIVD